MPISSAARSSHVRSQRGHTRCSVRGMRRLACLLLASSACTVSSYVRSQAAADFGCAEDQVHTEDVGYDVRATGCGRSAIYNSALSSPLRRASYDLACPPEKLEMVELGNNAIGVSGCGKRTSYAYVDAAWVQGAVTIAAP